jgi:hypothetical protein
MAKTSKTASKNEGRLDRRRGMDARAARGRAGSLAMRVGEVLDAAHSFPIRQLPEMLEDDRLS